VRNGNYRVCIPHEIAHRYNDRPGRVYILTSKWHPSECKLGATTMPMFQRCATYEAKYGYRVEQFFSIETPKCFALEKQVAGRLSKFRSAANATGSSIEWYRIEPGKMKQVIISADREM